MTTDAFDTEEVTYTAELSWWPFCVKLALAGVLVAGGVAAFLLANDSYFRHVSWLALIGILFGLGWVLKKRSVTVRVTPYHVFVKSQLIRLHTVTLNLHRIESIDIDQSFFQRMLGFGNVVIRGLGNDDIVLNGLAAPDKLKEAVMEIRKDASL